MKTFYQLLGFNPQQHNVRTELLAGLTTFLTMSYILAVNPDILSSTGMDKGAVFTATALASAIGTLVLAFLAKLPFAQAPGMGINAFFAFTLCGAMGYSWETALAAVFVEGIIFILLTVFKVRQMIVESIPRNLRYAISGGIGFFIAFVGLKNAGVIVDSPATFVQLGQFTPASTLACVGVLLSGILMIRKVRGALFISIILCTIIGIPLGVTQLPTDFHLVSMPQSLSPTFLKLDFAGLLDTKMILTILVLVFLDIFNTLGTLIGAAAGTSLESKNGKMHNFNKAMMADAIATSTGALLGTSTVTTYVESGTGIAEGGRTGMTALSVSICFIIALFFSPLFLLIPAAAITGALVLVGALMMSSMREIDFTDLSETLPCFVTMLLMVLTFNIADGMALGLVTYTFVKLFTNQRRDISRPLYLVTGLLMLIFIYA